MNKIQQRREKIQNMLDSDMTRPEIIDAVVETEGLSRKYVTTFVYNHFGGKRYKTPAHRRKRPTKKEPELDIPLFGESDGTEDSDDDLL